MALFKNAGFLRSHSYDADEFSRIAFGDGFTIRPAATEWEDDGATYPSSTNDGLYFCYQGIQRLEGLCYGKFRVVIKDDVCYFYYVPKVILNTSNAYYLYDDTTATNGLLIDAWSTDITGNDLPVVALYGAPDGNLTLIKNPTDGQLDMPGFYKLYDSAKIDYQYPAKVVITGASTNAAEMNDCYKDTLLIKYSTTRPSKPSNNMMWVFPAQ